jgi:hypothetical protein
LPNYIEIQNNVIYPSRDPDTKTCTIRRKPWLAGF